MMKINLNHRIFGILLVMGFLSLGLTAAYAASGDSWSNTADSKAAASAAATRMNPSAMKAITKVNPEALKAVSKMSPSTMNAVAKLSKSGGLATMANKKGAAAPAATAKTSAKTTKKPMWGL